jgi:hypothetical protein
LREKWIGRIEPANPEWLTQRRKAAKKKAETDLGAFTTKTLLWNDPVAGCSISISA